MIPLKPEKIKYLIVHHSAVRQSTNRNQFDAIKRYHIQTRGWADIGYHWLIEPDGTLKAGRDENWVGAHARTSGVSMNFRSLGICLVGNFEVDNPTREQINTLEDILGRLRAKYSIMDRANVLGHQEIPHPTACPGKNLLSYLKSYRSRAEEPEPANNKKRSRALEEIIKILRKFKLIP